MITNDDGIYARCIDGVGAIELQFLDRTIAMLTILAVVKILEYELMRRSGGRTNATGTAAIGRPQIIWP